MEGGAQSSHQLDFYQAMADFKLMFPNMDEEVIEAVLRANEGAVDGTIDQLLTMNTDFGADQSMAVSAALIARGQPPFSAKLKRIVELGGRSKLTTSEASSGSLEPDASRSSFGRHLASKSSVKSSVGSESSVQRPRKVESRGFSSVSTNLSEDLLLDTTTDDSRVFSSSVDVRDGACGGDEFTPSQQSWDDDSFLPAAPAPPIPPRSPLLSAPPLPPKMSLLGVTATFGRGVNGSLTTPEQKKTTSRHWDPPMLGKLPDDFLRLEIAPPTQTVFKTSPTSAQPGTFMSHSAHEATRTRVSCQETSPIPCTRIRPARLSSETGQTRSHHHSTSGKSHRSSHDGVMSVPHSCDCQRHSCGAITMHERPQNSKRRLEIDADTWQMLEDERLALVLQSEEFLAELRQNEDFMRSLEHEGQTRNSGEEVQSMLLEKSAHPNDSAEFRTLLKHVGDTSKKKLIAAAQKFFAKCKKKSQKPILKDTAAPSTINLLDDEETENKDLSDEHFQFTDEQYKWWSQQ